MRLNKKIPRILLIGVGRFGEKHLNTLLKLEKQGLLSLVGAVVKTTESRKIIETKYGIKVWTNLSDELLEQCDAVDIVTPPEIHHKIVMRCLPFTNILVEKPLAMTTKEAQEIERCTKKYNKILMVGHIFRFDSVVTNLRLLLKPLQEQKILIRGEFINPLSNDVGRDISLEMPHFFDIINFVIENHQIDVISTSKQGRLNTVNIKYKKNTHAHLKLGWSGEERKRFLNFYFSTKEIKCDFLKQSITITDHKTGKFKKIDCSSKIDSLTKEILCFLEILSGKKVPYPDVRTGVELVSVAESARVTKNKVNQTKPRVAIIGVGIFGANCAIELGKFCDTTLFEKNGDIMLEASLINQYRHHWGYHYPRSHETVRDIRKAIVDFEKLYDKAIVRNFPTYYYIAKKGSKTSRKNYLKFCKENDLPFLIEQPDKRFVNKQKVSLSIKTWEPIYDYKKLKGLVTKHMSKLPNLKIKLNTSVVGGSIDKDGRKKLIIKNKKGVREIESFDYVINATYSKYNQFLEWFNFPIKPVRIDLVEALIVKLPIPKISLAIMDGPFTNLVPTADDHLFTLVHIKESILERYVPLNGLPRTTKPNFTKVQQTLRKSAEWLPLLENAEVVETRHVFRAVNAYREHDDARPSDLTHHSFGCWSILGGKIINSVTAAKEISLKIKEDYGR